MNGLHVAVRHALVVGGLQGDGRLPDILAGQAERQGPHLVDQVEQVAPVDVLLDDVRGVAVGAGVEHGGDVRALDQGGGVGAGHVVGRGVERGQPVGLQESQGHRLLKGRVRGLVGDPGRPVGQHVEDAVAADGQAGRRGLPQLAGLERGEPAAVLGVVGQGDDVAPRASGRARSSLMRSSSSSRVVWRPSKNWLVAGCDIGGGVPAASEAGKRGSFYGAGGLA